MKSALINADCLTGMANLPSEQFDLIFADPPYNINYDYCGEYEDNLPSDQYLAWCNAWLSQIYRLTKPNGTFWLMIGDKSVSELDVYSRQCGFLKRSHVVWYYTFGTNQKKNLTRSHTHLLYFTKNAKQFTFNPDEIRVPSARQLEYNDKRASAKGKIPDDTWILSPKYAEGAFQPLEDTWTASRVCGTFKERAGVPTQAPVAILERVIKLCSNPGDFVMDPFLGSGGTCAVAKQLGRKYYGFELSKTFYDVAVERVKAAT